jgi:hypothetical protein
MPSISSPAAELYQHSLRLKKSTTPELFEKCVQQQRRSGRTTGGLLRAIGKAMMYPGDPVYYWDHAHGADVRYSLKVCTQLIDKLGLSYIEVSSNRMKGCLEIVSTWYGIQDPDNWKGPALTKEEIEYVLTNQ